MFNINFTVFRSVQAKGIFTNIWQFNVSFLILYLFKCCYASKKLNLKFAIATVSFHQTTNVFQHTQIYVLSVDVFKNGDALRHQQRLLSSTLVQLHAIYCDTKLLRSGAKQRSPVPYVP